MKRFKPCHLCPIGGDHCRHRVVVDGRYFESLKTLKFTMTIEHNGAKITLSGGADAIKMAAKIYNSNNHQGGEIEHYCCNQLPTIEAVIEQLEMVDEVANAGKGGDK